MDLLWWLNGGGALFDGWSPANNLLQGHAYVCVDCSEESTREATERFRFQIVA